MNLDQITTKCWILALFERDDGERLLLGDGWFDFKDSLQHFQPNTFANDVIELQGSDGQMLAGQVRRGAPQSFDGYIGDPITNRQTIEQHRREFLMFFRKRHHYKVVYIFPDGTAIQRKQGYITDAPSVPEIRQKFPEYHVALNFEDVNYYEYAENAQGEEIFSNIRNINISTAATGGLVWDNLGAVSDQMGWKDIATATGQMLTITNPESIKAPIASFEMTGNTTQSGTPTPSAPVPIQTTTGRQTVGIVGKNLFDKDDVVSGVVLVDGSISTAYGDNKTSNFIPVTPSTTYRVSGRTAWGVEGTYTQDKTWIGRLAGDTFTTQANCYWVRVTCPTADINSAQLEQGGQATTYEPYKGQNYEINLGKNLFDKDNAHILQAGITTTKIESATANRTLWIPCEPNTTYTVQKRNDGDTNRFNVATTATTPAIDVPITNRTENPNASSITYTTSANAKYLCVQYFRTAETTLTEQQVLDSIQIEKGSTASSYSAYFEPIELCKIGTYQDRIYKENGKWWLEKQVGKVVLTGSSSETWAYNATYSGFRYTNAEFNVSSVNPSNDLICSHFTVATVRGTSPTPPIIKSYTGTSDKTYAFFCDGTSDLATFKTWLASNPTTVYYALATPTTTEITNEEILEGLHSAAGLKLFPGQNNIMDQTPSAQPTMTVQYYTALGPGGGLVWESGEAGGATIIEASGLDSAFPLWTVPGPSTNPTLTNITTGQSITWQGTVPAGQTLEIDMDKQTATLAGANVYAFVSGDWIRIDPGPNRMTYVGTGATQASTLSWNNIVG